MIKAFVNLELVSPFAGQPPIATSSGMIWNGTTWQPLGTDTTQTPITPTDDLESIKDKLVDQFVVRARAVYGITEPIKLIFVT